jgi:hypothetical protein
VAASFAGNRDFVIAVHSVRRGRFVVKNSTGKRGYRQ